jgi:5-methylcytosine-specific restriction endonuclease McrA
MTRLTNLKPRLSSLPAALSSIGSVSQPRDTMPYRTYKWQRLRDKVLVRDKFTCAMCGRIQIGKGRTIVDHRKPHGGDLTLFWDENNLQVLCKVPCHEQHKKRLEAKMPAGVWY